MADKYFTGENDIIMSGDISFSYIYQKEEIRNLADLKYRKVLNSMKSKSKWALLFSRENNFGPENGVWITEGIVHIRDISGDLLQYDLDDVLFGSSSNLEDHDHMLMLQEQHGGCFFLYVISYVNNVKMIKKMRFSYVNLDSL